MTRLALAVGAVVLVALLGSQAAGAESHGLDPNPPAQGFNQAGSDAHAIEIADAVMERMGGRAAWDQTRYLTWSFFGRRQHVWDKHTGNIRVEGVGRDDNKPYVILMNIHSKDGRAWRSGEEITEPEERAKMLDLGEAIWINDSYWLVMPYKLKDSGVTLKHLGEREMEDDRKAEVLQLTFQEVGRTPENKYHVYVAGDTGLVEQWDFYRHASDPEPEFNTPWHNWQKYGRILLSDNRGESGHTDVAVFEELPESVFTSPEPVDWQALDLSSPSSDP